MKKFSVFLLALVLSCGQAFGFTVTEQSRERYTDVDGDSFDRVIGYLTLDSSHPASGESLLPSNLGLVSFSRITVDASGPAAWPVSDTTATTDVIRRFAFDYTTNKVYVTSLSGVGLGYGALEVSGPITYDLAYLTRVPFEAVGPITA